jgi:hypothetical protein
MAEINDSRMVGRLFFSISPVFLHEGRRKNSELPDFPSFQAVPFHAPAAPCLPGEQFILGYNDFVPAIASACPCPPEESVCMEFCFRW